jgi:hypothetical protein
MDYGTDPQDFQSSVLLRTISIVAFSHRIFSVRPHLLRPRSRGDGQKMAEGLAISNPRLLLETNPQRRYQATKEDDYWLVTTHHML